MAVFKRLWQLQIEINGNIKTFKELNWNEESLKIEFNVKNGIGGAFSNGDITIYNFCTKGFINTDNNCCFIE